MTAQPRDWRQGEAVSARSGARLCGPRSGSHTGPVAVAALVVAKTLAVAVSVTVVERPPLRWWPALTRCVVFPVTTLAIPITVVVSACAVPLVVGAVMPRIVVPVVPALVRVVVWVVALAQVRIVRLSYGGGSRLRGGPSALYRLSSSPLCFSPG